jgi:glutathione S-transferase
MAPMLTLYFCPGACSTAAHIALEETGAPYQGTPVLIPKGEHQTEAYAAVNPRHQVPALSVDGKVITECVAILAYVARRYPKAQLLPADEVEQACCIATLAWIASAVDPLFRRAARPERFVADENAQLAVKDAARDAYWVKCREIDSLLSGQMWMMGAQYTVCDPYALVYFGWGQRLGLPMAELSAYSAFKDRMLERPAVRKILERELSPMLTRA